MDEIRHIYRGTCDHCEAERERLARFELRRADGLKRILMVCRYCFIHLKSRQSVGGPKA